MSDGRFLAGSAHRRATDLPARLLLLRSMAIGTLFFRRIWRDGKRQWVSAWCSSCRRSQKIDVHNVLGGKTTNCVCHRAVKYATKGERQLAERHDAARHRCCSPNDLSYADYGGRGIKMLFPSREAYVRYIYDRWPLDSYSGLDVDRINTNGHYEPGNLRLATRRQNSLNRRKTKSIEFEGETIPCADLWFRLRESNPNFGLSRGTTTKLANKGATAADILGRKPRLRRQRG